VLCVAGYNGGGEVTAGREDGRLRVGLGRMGAMKLLLETKTEVNGRGSDGWIALYVAGYNGGGEVAAGREDGGQGVGLGMDGLRYMSPGRREVMKQLLEAKTVVKGWDSGWMDCATCDRVEGR
jgi:hypothetical protein